MTTKPYNLGVGVAGAAGLSAYQVAVANGFVGNEVAWLASLVGTAGAAGAPGPNQVTTSTVTNITGVLAGDGALIVAATSIDWVNKRLIDPSGVQPSIAWGVRQLLDNDNDIALDWTSRLLRTETTIAVSWNSRELVNSDGATIVDWSNATALVSSLDTAGMASKAYADALVRDFRNGSTNLVQFFV